MCMEVRIFQQPPHEFWNNQAHLEDPIDLLKMCSNQKGMTQVTDFGARNQSSRAETNIENKMLMHAVSHFPAHTEMRKKT